MQLTSQESRVVPVVESKPKNGAIAELQRQLKYFTRALEIAKERNNHSAVIQLDWKVRELRGVLQDCN